MWSYGRAHIVSRIGMRQHLRPSCLWFGVFLDLLSDPQVASWAFRTTRSRQGMMKRPWRIGCRATCHGPRRGTMSLRLRCDQGSEGVMLCPLCHP